MLKQSRTQSPQAFWPAVGRQERLCGTGILFNFFGLAALLRLALFYCRNSAVIKFQFPRVSSGDQPLAKEPEDSGWEIGVKIINIVFRFTLLRSVIG